MLRKQEEDREYEAYHRNLRQRQQGDQVVRDVVPPIRDSKYVRFNSGTEDHTTNEKVGQSLVEKTDSHRIRASSTLSKDSYTPGERVCQNIHAK